MMLKLMLTKQFLPGGGAAIIIHTYTQIRPFFFCNTRWHQRTLLNLHQLTMMRSVSCAAKNRLFFEVAREPVRPSDLREPVAGSDPTIIREPATIIICRVRVRARG